MRYLLILLLAGCASTQDASVRVIWHRMDAPTVSIIDGRYAFRAKGYAKKIDGVCHVWAPDSAVKTVNGKRVIDEEKMSTLGHEIKHCFDGSYHD